MLATGAGVSKAHTIKCSLQEDVHEGHWMVVYDRKIGNRDDEYTRTLFHFWLTALLVSQACFVGERIELYAGMSRQL